MKTQIPILMMCIRLLAQYPWASKREQALLDIIELQNEKIAILQKRLPKRIKLTWAERLRLSTIARRIPFNEYMDLVYHLWKPETVIGWIKRYQRIQALKRRKAERKRRPPLTDKVKREIVKLYKQGITTIRKIVGELKKCDMDVSRSSVAKTLHEKGLMPSGDNDSWLKFLKRHAHLIAATDFFSVPIGLFGKVVNIDVLIAIEHDTRRVHFLGMTPNADTLFMKNVAKIKTNN